MPDTFALAAGAAVAEFYEKGVPDGGYLKVEPRGDGTPERWVPGDVRGYSQDAYDVVADLVTDMYGPHPTVIGIVYRDSLGQFYHEWQDL